MKNLSLHITLKLNLQILKSMQFTKAGSWCEIDGTEQSNLNVMVSVTVLRTKTPHLLCLNKGKCGSMLLHPRHVT